MKKLEHFLNEAIKDVKMTDLDQLTITKDGKTEVHTASSSKTVEDAQGEETETDPTKKPKKIDKEKKNGNKNPDDNPNDTTKDTETKKED